MYGRVAMLRYPLLAIACVLGCGPTTTKSSFPQSQEASGEARSAAPPLSRDAGVSGEERWLDELRATLDVFSTAVAQDQVPPPDFNPTLLERTIEKPFPGVGFARVRGFVWWNDSGPGATFNVPACVFGALTNVGTLCPSTVLPGIELQPARQWCSWRCEGFGASSRDRGYPQAMGSISVTMAWLRA